MKQVTMLTITTLGILVVISAHCLPVLHDSYYHVYVNNTFYT